MPVSIKAVAGLCAIALAIAAGLRTLPEFDREPTTSPTSPVQIVAGSGARGAGEASMASAPSMTPPPPTTGMAHDERLVAEVTSRFPMIREAHVDCDGACRLVMALGDQDLGLSPFGGALERYLAEQGYAPAGSVVVDQPGDNDIVLTIPVTLPHGR